MCMKQYGIQILKLLKLFPEYNFKIAAFTLFAKFHLFQNYMTAN